MPRMTDKEIEEAIERVLGTPDEEADFDADYPCDCNLCVGDGDVDDWYDKPDLFGFDMYDDAYDLEDE